MAASAVRFLLPATLGFALGVVFATFPSAPPARTELEKRPEFTAPESSTSTSPAESPFSEPSFEAWVARTAVEASESLLVTVWDADRRPVPRVPVHVQSELELDIENDFEAALRAIAVHRSSRRARSGADGSVRFEPLPRGPIGVRRESLNRYRPPSYSERRVVEVGGAVHIVEGAESGFGFRKPPSWDEDSRQEAMPSIDRVFLVSRGTPVDEAEFVRDRHRTEWDDQSRHAPGVGALRAIAHGSLASAPFEELRLEPGSVIDLHPATSLHGVVFGDVGFQTALELEGLDVEAFERTSLRSRQDRSFGFVGLEPGRYRLRQLEGNVSVREREIEIEEGYNRAVFAPPTLADIDPESYDMVIEFVDRDGRPVSFDGALSFTLRFVGEQGGGTYSSGSVTEVYRDASTRAYRRPEWFSTKSYVRSGESFRCAGLSVKGSDGGRRRVDTLLPEDEWRGRHRVEVEGLATVRWTVAPGPGSEHVLVDVVGTDPEKPFLIQPVERTSTSITGLSLGSYRIVAKWQNNIEAGGTQRLLYYDRVIRVDGDLELTIPAPDIVTATIEVPDGPCGYALNLEPMFEDRYRGEVFVNDPDRWNPVEVPAGDYEIEFAGHRISRTIRGGETIKFEIPDQDRRVFIARLPRVSPNIGFEVGDEIIAIDGVPLSGWCPWTVFRRSSKDVPEAIRTLRVRRSGEEFDMTFSAREWLRAFIHAEQR